MQDKNAQNMNEAVPGSTKKKFNPFEFRVLPWILVAISVCLNLFLYNGIRQLSKQVTHLKDYSQSLTEEVDKVRLEASVEKNKIIEQLADEPKEPSTQVGIPHEFLPSFDIDYSDSWNLTVKQFRVKDTGPFESKYFPTCHENCMGVRLSKNNISLDLIFDIAYDNNAFRCSNSVAYQKLSNNWYRIKDSSGYWYTNRVQLDKTLKPGKFPSPFGEVDDEWSAVKDETYEICVQGSGEFLEEFSPVHPEAGILMEFPRIIGNPSGGLLDELDSMVISIQGLKS